MARSVIIKTPIPTLDELGKKLGLTKTRQRFLIRLVDEKSSRRPTSYAFKSLSGPAKKETKRVTRTKRKITSRARKIA
jgi:hypothetical protein